MFFLLIIRFVRGYVIVKVEKNGAERFVNLCSKNRISVWNIKSNTNEMLISMRIKDYVRLKNLRKNIKFPPKFKIYKKIGLPFILKSYEKRKGVAVGIILSLILLNFLSNYVWDIRVVGNEKIPTNEITSVCEELGVKIGIRKRTIDTYSLSPSLILKCDGIAWCSFNIEGSVLTVEISEEKDSQNDNEKSASNMIATFDGVIKSMKISSGTNIVHIGDAVRKGDLLVSGAINYGEKTNFIKCEGEVIAETERTFVKSIPSKYYINVFNGKSKRLKVLNFFNIKVPLYLGGIRYENLSETKTSVLKMFGRNLPITLVSKTFSEIVETEVLRNEDEILNQALCEIAMEIKTLPITDVKIVDILRVDRGDSIEVALKTKCLENIAMYQEIKMNSEK